MMGGDAKAGQRAARDVPWFGLLLWIFACAALCVSLILRDEGLDREQRMAAHREAAALNASLPRHAYYATRQDGELSVFSSRWPPPR